MDAEWLEERFEQERPRLLAVAFRLLGSRHDAEDAVQEAWLRLNRADSRGVDNLSGWLTTVVARIALDLLRKRGVRAATSLDEVPPAEQTVDPSVDVEVADAATRAAQRSDRHGPRALVPAWSALQRRVYARAQRRAGTWRAGPRGTGGVLRGQRGSRRPCQGHLL